MKIIDMHHHFISQRTVEYQTNLYGVEAIEEFRKNNPEQYKIAMELPEPIIRAEQIIQSMNEKGIDQVILMATSGDIESLFEVHKKFPVQFPGVIPYLQPESDKDPEIIEEWKKKGAVSLKLYPGEWEKYTLSSPELLPYFKKMVDLNISPIIKVGVIKGDSSSWPANPIDIRPWLTNKDLTSLKFIFAHFGAGYLREILMMSYAHRNRIFVDTSGSNDWIDWSPWNDLTQVFEKSIKALSSSNILFGTDSNLSLIRSDVVLRQKGIIQDLVTKKVITLEDQEKILSKNAIELFDLKV